MSAPRVAPPEWDEVVIDGVRIDRRFLEALVASVTRSVAVIVVRSGDQLNATVLE